MSWYYWYLAGFFTLPVAVVLYFIGMIVAMVIGETRRHYKRIRTLKSPEEWIKEARVAFSFSAFNRMYALRSALRATFGFKIR